MTNVIPTATRLAAKRGFIRTSAQTLSSAIPTSAIAISLSGDIWLGLGLGVAGAVASSILAGTASALAIISSGIPDEYIEAAEGSGLP